MSEAGPRVFISSTYLDNVARREHVIRVIQQADLLPVGMEWLAAESRPPLEACLAEVERSQLFVLIIAARYGWIPEGEELSITELEYRRAVDKGIDRLVFICKRDELRLTDVDPDDRWAKQEKLETFIASITKTDTPAYFTETQLSGDVRHAIEKWRSLRASSVDASTPPPHTADALLRRYLTQVESRYRNVDLLGFGEQLKPTLPIEQLYVPLRASVAWTFDAGAGLGKFDDEKLSRAEQVERDVPVTDAFRHAHAVGGDSPKRGVALLGDPGAGKTTAARRLCWQTAAPAHGPSTLDLPEGTIPVLIRLRRLRKEHVSEGLSAFIEREIESSCDGTREDGKALAKALLGHDHVLWIFDGLDEVADLDTRTKVSRWIEEHLLRHPDHRILVTSRYAGYQEEARLGGAFLELHVQPLDDAQQQAFVSQWYHAVEAQLRPKHPGAAKKEADERTASLTTVLTGPDFRGQRLATIAANPLLLSVLCIVHRKDVELPRKRSGVYEKCVAVLLEHWKHTWRQEQGVVTLDPVAARAILGPLAWWLQQEDGRTQAPAEELAKPLGDALRSLKTPPTDPSQAVGLLARIRDDSGLLVTPDPGQFGFLHLSFQEYLAAQYATKHDRADELAAHFGESWWKEVGLLAIGEDNESFSRDYFEAVLNRLWPNSIWGTRRGPTAEQLDLLTSTFDEALHLPMDVFLKRIKRGPLARRRFLLRLVREHKDPALVDLARSLATHGDDMLRGTAREVLAFTPMKLPAEPKRSVGTARGSIPGTEDHWIHRPTDMIFVPIPNGTFRMGSPMNERGRLSSEGPQHEVAVPSFWLAKYPVTNAQYAKFVEQTGAAKPAEWTNSRFNGAQQPVVGVSWEDAQAFCEWAGLRLPSEAEWEYACRAGTTSAYSFGSLRFLLRRHAWFRGNADRHTHPVGEKRPNPWGLHDMHGNVWEWCKDQWHDDYDGAPVDGTAWSGRGSDDRVMRGGGWFNTARFCRSAFRSRVRPDARWGGVGFRPARSLSRSDSH